MIQSLPPDYANFAANYAAANEAKKNQNRTEKTKSLKTRFTDMLKKSEPELEAQEGMPPEIAGMSEDDAVAYLLDQTTMAGDELRHAPTAEQFAAYRQKVSQFLKFVESRSYDVEEVIISPTARRPRGKKQYVIRLVNEKLEELARDVLLNQADQLKMLSKLDEINGLLVDLTS